MGLFDKLFEKKECAICGKEVGLLGNRKLEDGNMCKDCTKKLSPWFSERRHSTVEEIKEQLAYREQNYQELRNFSPTRRFGDRFQLIAEERNGVPYRFIVTDSKDYMEENSDLILFSDVSMVDIEIKDHERELFRTNNNNERVSYNPPRFEIDYDFYVTLSIENNPYFDEIRFKLNSRNVTVTTERIGGRGIIGSIGRTVASEPYHDPMWRKYKQMTEDIENLVNDSRRISNMMAQAQQAAPKPKFCPNCGAPASQGKFCQECGGKL